MLKLIWKPFTIGLISLISITTFSYAQPFLTEEIPSASLVDDTTQVNRLLTLRNIATGELLRNNQYEDERNLIWIIEEVPPEKTFFQTSSGITQFHTPDLPRCLYTIQNRIITANCDPLDAGSLWQIIPTTKGGVEIKSLRSGQCLSAGDSRLDFRLENCAEDPEQPASVKLLWVFAPAAINTSLSPELP